MYDVLLFYCLFSYAESYNREKEGTSQEDYLSTICLQNFDILSDSSVAICNQMSRTDAYNSFQQVKIKTLLRFLQEGCRLLLTSPARIELALTG